MQFARTYFVYILTNKNKTVLYVGVTNKLNRRLQEHKEKFGGSTSFTKKYNLDILVYYEGYNDIRDAISREKQLKGGSRKKKIDLIISVNQEWRDLSSEVLF